MTATPTVHRSDGSGTTFNFTHYLSQVSPGWKNAIGEGTTVNWPTGVGGKGNEGVAGYVKQIPGSIGYVEYAYALQNHIPWAVVQNAALLVQVEVGSVQAAGYGTTTLPRGREIVVLFCASESVVQVDGWVTFQVWFELFWL